MRTASAALLLLLVFSAQICGQDIIEHAQAATADGDIAYKWGAIFDAQIKPGSRTYWGGNLMLPLMQDETSLLMLDVRGSMDEVGWYARRENRGV